MYDFHWTLLIPLLTVVACFGNPRLVLAQFMGFHQGPTLDLFRTVTHITCNNHVNPLNIHFFFLQFLLKLVIV